MESDGSSRVYDYMSPVAVGVGRLPSEREGREGNFFGPPLIFFLRVLLAKRTCIQAHVMDLLS